MRLTLLAALLLLSTNLIDLKAQTLQEQLGNLATIIVDTSGKGNYTKLQDAINAVPDYSSQRTIIYLRNGIYHEKIDVPESKQNLTLVGENMDSTVISWDDYSGKVVDGVELGTSTSHTMIVSSTDFYAFNLTIQNTAGDVGQAVALNTKGDRQTFVHCKLLGYQDTYYVKGYGRFYLKDCYIEGATDYIFGRGVALFDSCLIHSVKSKSYITAASTPQDWKYGYVFQNCKLTANSDLSRVHLGRPWRPYCQVVYMYCEMGKYINPVGWHNWGKPEREESTFYAEYKCFGPGADTSNRVSWSQQLTDEQASQYTLPAIFAKDVNPSPFSSDWDPNLSNHPIYQLIERNTIKFLDPRNANARLSSIQYNQLILQNFHPDTLSYEIILPASFDSISTIEALAENDDASVDIQLPASLPGMARINVTSVDKSNSKAYILNFLFTPTAIKKQSFPKIEIVNSFTNDIQLSTNQALSHPMYIKIFNMQGSLVLQKTIPAQFSGQSSIQTPGLKNGWYICQLIYQDMKKTNKLLKTN